MNLKAFSRQIRSISTSIQAKQATAATPSTSSSPPPPARWTPETLRTGVLARKKGMTCLWSDGNRIPVTVLHLDEVQVLSTNSHPTSDPANPMRHSVVVGCSPRREKTTSGAMLGQFKKAGIEPKMRVVEFPVTEDAIVKAGETITAAHFVPGQHVDVQATSFVPPYFNIGKGFQGVMKRHGFAGLRASHGVSISHRSHGSTGQHQEPGRVFPGKKMAGRMGGTSVTTQNLLVYRIDLLHNVLYVKGAIPGPPGSFVRVTDAIKKVGWRARAIAKRGGGEVEGDVLPGGITGLPMPIGGVDLSRIMPREIQVGDKIEEAKKV